MANVRIEERFQLSAPPERVWGALNDPASLVVCIPGASLDSSGDDGTYAGTVKVKVGAVRIQYGGTVRFDEADASTRTLKLTGEGAEKGGAGAVRMTMESVVHEMEGGGSDVSVLMDMQLAGKIVRFGRGMIQSVSAELFKQFTDCLATKLEQTGPEGGPAASGDVGTDAESGDPNPSDPSPEQGEALALFPLLLRSFRRWLAGLFGKG